MTSLAAVPTAPGHARAYVRAAVHAWGISSLAEVAELVATELVTNAVCASEGPDLHPSNQDDQTPAPTTRREPGWLVMVLDFLDARDVDLSPGSPDLDGIPAALAAINAVRACDAGQPVTGNVTALQDKASALLGKPPDGQPWDMYRIAVEASTARS